MSDPGSKLRVPVLGDIINQIISLVAVDGVLDDSHEINENSRFYYDIDGDSLDMLVLITDLEKEYDIIIDEKDLELVETIRHLAELVRSKIDIKATRL